MTDPAVYEYYSGPMLTTATLDGVDILETIQRMYGSERNWQNRLWRCNEFLSEADVGKVLYCGFVRKDGRAGNCTHTIESLSEVINSPIFSQFCDCGNQKTCRDVSCSKINDTCACNSGNSCNRICGRRNRV